MRDESNAGDRAAGRTYSTDGRKRLVITSASRLTEVLLLMRLEPRGYFASVPCISSVRAADSAAK
ncbi:MAG: hypothetical protein JWM76_1827 [Pseudonocardiales bacterium]|nr:hypothetical protein [Pseudonocardiales bacterium]